MLQEIVGKGESIAATLLFIPMESTKNKRKSFVFYKEWYDAIAGFDTSVQVEVLTSMVKYAFEGEKAENLSSLAQMALNFIVPQIDNDKNRADEINKMRRECGMLGGRPKKGDAKVEEKEPEKPVETEKKRIFKKPTIEEVRSYISEKGYHFDAESFFAFYESKGWKIGNQPMKSWQAACVTWEKRYKQDGQQPQQPQQQKPVKPRDPNDPEALSEYYKILKENKEREESRTAEEDKRLERQVIILNYMSAHKYDYLDLKIDEVRENEYFTVTGLKDGTQYWVCKVGNCKRRFYMDYRTNKLEECKVSAPFRPNNDFVWDKTQWVEGC